MAGAEPLCIRPERLRVAWTGEPERRSGTTSRPGTVTSFVYVGHATQVRVQLDGGPAVVALVPEKLPGSDAELVNRARHSQLGRRRRRLASGPGT